MTDLISPVSGWGSNVGGPALQAELVDPINEWTADLGYILTGLFTAANGTTIVTTTGVTLGRIIGNKAFIRLQYTVNATTVAALGSPGTNGELNNTVVANIVDARFQPTGPFVDQGLISAALGRTTTHVVDTATNTIKLCAIAGSAAIANGDSFSCYGEYLLD